MKPRRGTRAAQAALALALALAAVSVSCERPADAAARRLVGLWMRETGAPAAQITVARRGEILWSEAFGRANVELGAPATTRTRFRVGSVSKSLTSAALGALVEEGKLDLDAPIQRYLPDYPEKPWPVTSRQLAGHLAGVRHYKGDEFESARHYDSVRASLAVFENDPLLFEPGTKYSYSSYGWNLLSAVLERAAGEPFLDLMRRRVFEPAGLRDTAADDPLAIVPQRASFYTLDESSALRNARAVDNSVKWASGGFVSTTEDLVRFAEALRAGRLLRPETVRLLWTSLETRDGQKTDYGLGWGVGRDARGRRTVSHSGGAQGGTAYLFLYPDEAFAVAMLVNSDVSFTRRTPRLARLLLDGVDAERRWEDGAGVSLVLPESWWTRYEADVKTGAAAEAVRPQASEVIRFVYLPTQRARGDQTLLTLFVFSKAGGARSGEIVGDSAGRVVVAEVPAANPYPAGTPDAKAFGAMRLDAAAVRRALAVRDTGR
ncbi:MAG TPA: serine hydrolase domain-containing protein [Thermoanaerobaculia bacterium]